MIYFRDQSFLNTFGKHLRKLREEKNITQEDLAFQAELDVTQIGRIERGVTNTSISNAYRIAKALNIQLKELFDLELEN